MRVFLRHMIVAAVLAGSVPAIAAEPVRQIGIYVQPFYEAARSPGERPRVAVGKQYNDLLSSSRREDILAARDLIVAKPALVTPMTMMVLAIRLYDVGLRDDAVFWFFAARGRYAILQSVLDVSSLTLVGVRNGMQDFADNAGPTLYGYAFCDLAREQATEDKALQWTIAHPYKQLFAPQLPARSDDRNKALADAHEAMKKQAADSRADLADPARRAQLQEARERSQADVKYCWK